MSKELYLDLGKKKNHTDDARAITENLLTYIVQVLQFYSARPFQERRGWRGDWMGGVSDRSKTSHRKFPAHKIRRNVNTARCTNMFN